MALGPELCPEHAPPGIEHGLRKGSLGKGGGAHVVDEDRAVARGQGAGKLVQVVRPAVFDLGMDRPLASLLAGALRGGKLALEIPVQRRRLDLDAVGGGLQVLQCEVDLDRIRRGMAGYFSRFTLTSAFRDYRPRASSQQELQRMRCFERSPLSQSRMGRPMKRTTPCERQWIATALNGIHPRLSFERARPETRQRSLRRRGTRADPLSRETDPRARGPSDRSPARRSRQS